jgi:hypothetical protein
MRIYLFLVFSTLSFLGFSQSINTAAVNVGGGAYARGYYQFDWNIGEGASIETFQSSGNYLLTTGVLQPLTEKVEFIDFLTYTWSSDEIAIFPIPTHTILEVDLKIRVKGPVTIQLFDQLGRVVLKSRIDYVINNGIQKLDLSGLIAGTYLNVILGDQLVYPVIRKGTFKIQKL